ncbi:predicted protein [Arabidopsis lyrata subsp. lyrata]|uniref:Predicted protein n=1 Tax=Arabidopsis lyrata subsp. lyrata TaxID=81972 RepID=D7KJA3_ARALL|nr:predicted protein [Arabidopsis lyrata subsp. lyrata]
MYPSCKTIGTYLDPDEEVSYTGFTVSSTADTLTYRYKVNARAYQIPLLTGVRDIMMSLVTRLSTSRKD